MSLKPITHPKYVNPLSINPHRWNSVQYHFATIGPATFEKARRLSPETCSVAKAEFDRMLAYGTQYRHPPATGPHLSTTLWASITAWSRHESKQMWIRTLTTFLFRRAAQISTSHIVSKTLLVEQLTNKKKHEFLGILTFTIMFYPIALNNTHPCGFSQARLTRFWVPRNIRILQVCIGKVTLLLHPQHAWCRQLETHRTLLTRQLLHLSTHRQRVATDCLLFA